MRSLATSLRTPPVLLGGLLIGLFLSPGSLKAQRTLNLPSPSFSFPGVVAIPNSDGTTYASVALSGLPAGFDIANGTYDAWCLDNFGRISPPYSFIAYDSYAGVNGDTNPKPPANVEFGGQTAWNETNWLMNHPQGNGDIVPAPTTLDTQSAIWTLQDPFYNSGFNSASANALVTEAKASGASFIPSAGQLQGVILYADGIQGVPSNQDIVITVRIPASPAPPPDVYEVSYFRNKNTGGPDDLVDIVDPATNGRGNLCAMIYVVTPDEELNECCGCLITPDQVIELGVQANLTGNPANGTTAHNGAIKIIKSLPTNPSAGGNAQCDPAHPVPTPTLSAWITHVQAGNAVTHSTESAFLAAGLSTAEENFLANACGFFENSLSGHGVCTCPEPLPQ